MDVCAVLGTVRSREVDREFVGQEQLDVIARERTNALPWRGQFTPGLPEILISSSSPIGAVLDPFVGSGTTLAEAMRAGLRSCGSEVNPAALSLASVYELAGSSPGDRERAIKRAERALQDVAIEASDGLLGSDAKPHEAVLRTLASLQDTDASKLVVATLMLAMGNGSEARLDRVNKGWVQVRRLVDSFPRDAVDTKVMASDARALPLSDESMGMVLTSPPYINVFNYHQNYRPVMEMLGWDILPAARSEIGSNRKHRSNRFLTVVQYCLDMAETLDELARVTKSGSPIVFIVGRESKVRGLSFPNGELLAALVEASPGLVFERWQDRSFVSRFAGRIYEEILTFRRVGDSGSVDPEFARALGTQVLREAQRQGPEGEAREQLEAAMVAADTVKASPPLDLRRV